MSELLQFPPRFDTPPGLRNQPIFSEAAVDVLKQSKVEAAKLGHRQAGTHHLLHALTGAPILGDRLRDLGLTAESVESQILTGTGRGEGSRLAAEALAFTDQVRQAISLAQQLRRTSGSRFVFPSHLLEAIVEDDANLAKGFLTDQGITDISFGRKITAYVREWEEAMLQTPAHLRY